MVRLRVLIPTVLALGLAVTLVYAQSQDYTGYLDAASPSQDYTLSLDVGQSVLLTVNSTDGDLDTVLTLNNPQGQLVSRNDDRGQNNYNSALGYTAVTSGDYTVVVSRYQHGGGSGHFRLTITVGNDESVLDPLMTLLSRVQLSGAELTHDTAHFRLHYTKQGSDAVTEDYAQSVALSIEEIYNIEINRMNWPIPPSDGVMGGNGLYDIYLKDVIGEGNGALGYTVPELTIGDNPNSPQIETHAATSYMAIDNNFTGANGANTTSISLMRTTFAHEFNHSIQFGYDGEEPQSWYFEATASWMETAAVVKDEDATVYVGENFQYPEGCFGTSGVGNIPDMRYGDWLFIQYLEDNFGMVGVQKLWQNIANYDNFAALEKTLAAYNLTLPDALAQYNLKNLIRDYALASHFDATVWMEKEITHPRRWSPDGEGVQELGANYFGVTLSPGTYYAGLVNDGGILHLWGIGIRGTEADTFDLGRGGTINTGGYDHYYLMVFNPVYDDDLTQCQYYTYDIDINVSKGAPAPLAKTWDASHFAPLTHH